MAGAMRYFVGEWLPSRPLRALVVFIAAQPALLYAYALEGSVRGARGDLDHRARRRVAAGLAAHLP